MSKENIKGIPLFFAALFTCICTFMVVLDFSIANVSLPWIAGDLAISPNEGTWVITSYAIGDAIVLPLAGWLSKRFGLVKTLVWATFLFTLFSWFSGFANNITSLVTYRFIQGATGAPLIPLSQTLIIRIFPENKKQMAIAMWAMVTVVGPIAGPMLGGWISDNYSWRWIFYINIPTGIIAGLVIWFSLMGEEIKTVKDKVDWWGLAFLALGVGSMQIVFDKGRSLNWFSSNFIIIFTVIALIFIALFIIWELTQENRIVDLSLFKDRNYTLSIIIIALGFMAFFSSIVTSSLWMQLTLNYTSSRAGLAMGAVGVLPFFLTPIVGLIMTKGYFKQLLTFSFLWMAFTFVVIACLNTQASFSIVVLTRFMFGLGIACFVAPLITASLSTLPVEKFSSASGIFHFFRSFMGAVGTSLGTAYWLGMADEHHAQLANSLGSQNIALDRTLSTLEGLGLTHSQSTAFVNNLVNEQSQMLGFNNLMYLSAALFIFLAVLTLFFKRPKNFGLLAIN